MNIQLINIKIILISNININKHILILLIVNYSYYSKNSGVKKKKI